MEMFRLRLAFLIILLAAPAYADSRFNGGFHGRGIHGGGFHRRFLHHFGRRGPEFLIGYDFGYNCGFGFGCGDYDDGYGYGYGSGSGSSYGSSYSYGSGGTRNAVSPGGYVPDPVGADIPPMIFPTNCWVRRAAYDPSGAYFGPVLVNLCRSADRVTVTDLKARPNMPEKGTGSGQDETPQSPGAQP